MSTSLLRDEKTMTTERTFPVLWQGPRTLLRRLEELGCPRVVPWAFIEEHEAECLRNHDQTVKKSFGCSRGLRPTDTSGASRRRSRVASGRTTLMFFDKALTAFVQMAVVLALYAPILIGARLWQRRKTRQRIAFEATLFRQNKCACGWSLPAGVGATTPVMVEGALAQPTTITFGCPTCGFPHVVPLRAMTVRSEDARLAG